MKSPSSTSLNTTMKTGRDTNSLSADPRTTVAPEQLSKLINSVEGLESIVLQLEKALSLQQLLYERQDFLKNSISRITAETLELQKRLNTTEVQIFPSHDSLFHNSNFAGANSAIGKE